MAGKNAKNGHDDSKHHDKDTPNHKEKDSHGHGGNHHSNGKLRRVTSATGANHREAASAAGGAPTSGATGAESNNATTTAPPGLQWPAFDRNVLHAYRRSYRLNTPTAFSREYHQWVLTQAGSVGLYSPTIARRKELRRQTTDQLTGAVRKHFNGQGVQENDVIVEFLHKVRSRGIPKQKRLRNTTEPMIPPE